LYLWGWFLPGPATMMTNKLTDGCNSPVVDNVTNINGTLIHGDDGKYYITSGSGQWGMSYWVCNSNVVKVDVPEEGIPVVFDADLMKYCGAYLDVAPAHVKVTKLNVAVVE
jgi:hypothetical protein